LKVIERYFEEDMLIFYKPEDIEEMTKKIIELYRDKSLRRKISESSYRFFDRYNLEGKTRDYLEMLNITPRKKTIARSFP
jgi:glycosyltransferase involved in cell wall biosynthesis